MLSTTNSFRERMNYGLDNFPYSYFDFGYQKQTSSLISNMSASGARGRGRDEEKYEEGDRAHGEHGTIEGYGGGSAKEGRKGRR